MRALITGVAGFAGSHLAQTLLGEGWDVIGIDRPGIARDNLESFLSQITFREFDILDPRGVEKIISQACPEVIFHLAAVAYIPYADNYPALVFDINAKGVLHIIDSISRFSPQSRLVLVSSSQVYGRVPGDRMPIMVDAAPVPVNIYGASKLCAEQLAGTWFRAGKLDSVIVRPFNHFGPRQRAQFVIADWSRQVALAEANLVGPSLRVGNLKAARDFTDVRDMVRAYRLAAEKGKSGRVYNICSGQARPVGDILKILLKKAKIPIQIIEEDKRFRQGEIPMVWGNCSRFQADTGWKLEYDLEAGLDRTLNYWREKIIRR